MPNPTARLSARPTTHPSTHARVPSLAFASAQVNHDRLYGPYKHLFEQTHMQKPHEHLKILEKKHGAARLKGIVKGMQVRALCRRRSAEGQSTALPLSLLSLSLALSLPLSYNALRRSRLLSCDAELWMDVMRPRPLRSATNGRR